MTKRLTHLQRKWLRDAVIGDKGYLTPWITRLLDDLESAETEIQNLEHDITRAYKIIEVELTENTGSD